MTVKTLFWVSGWTGHQVFNSDEGGTENLKASSRENRCFFDIRFQFQEQRKITIPTSISRDIWSLKIRGHVENVHFSLQFLNK